MKPTELYLLKCNSYIFPIWYTASTSPTCYLYQTWKKRIAADHLGDLVLYVYCDFARSGSHAAFPKRFFDFFHLKDQTVSCLLLFFVRPIY